MPFTRLRPPAIALLLAVLLPPGAGLRAAEEAPSRFGPDAPELARSGEDGVGVRTLHLVQHIPANMLGADAAHGAAPPRDRELTVDLWYPARASIVDAPASYTAAFPAEPPAPPASFTVPGIAVRDAKAAGGNYPLVIVSHGYSNAPAAMTWLTENLASKGYVVAAIRHEDPAITDASQFFVPLLRRPLDIAFVAKSLQESLAAEHLIDPTRTALIGYSIGGYGVLTAGGASLDPNGNAAKIVPNGQLLPYTTIGARRADVTVGNLRAIVAISPAGGGGLGAWGQDGLHAIKAPLLLIAGNQDHTVDYPTGARAFFADAVNSHRYLLTFKEAGHSIGLNPAPASMRHHLWDQDWFEDPVWSKERVNAINAHFITAFLDLYVKDEPDRAAYLNVPVPESDDGAWPADDPAPYAAYSPGTGKVTVWKGFQRKHAQGLELLQAQAGAAAVAADPTTVPLHPPAPSGPAANADWALLSRYREANVSLQPDAARIVFMGDSITEAWARDPTFGANPHFVGRGISGQTTQQMLIRFRADVIDMKPALVHLMAGTNDVAGNNGPETDADIEAAIASMVELARAHQVKVVLASIPPAADFNWRPGLKPIPRIRRLNAWLEAYANEVGITYVDYWPALAAEDGSMKSALSPDGVHPNSAGYAAMQPLTLAAIRSALAKE